jgi:hypothetical protein
VRPDVARLFAGPIALFLLFFLMVPLLPCTAARAHAQVTLAWTASSSSNVAGYDLYYGTTSGSLPNSINVGNVTSYTMTGLSPGTTYYFAVTAYDSSGDQSGDSSVVSYTVPSGCTYSISPTGQAFAASGGTGSVSVTTQSGCAWTAVSGASWISITSGGSGTGSGTVGYSVAANKTTSSLTAASTIAGLSFTVTQAGVTGGGVTAYTVTASAGTGGTISPSGAVLVDSGSSQTFTIAPSSDYTVSGVTVDGTSIGAVTSYTFSNVRANHTIGASFSAASGSPVGSEGSDAVNASGQDPGGAATTEASTNGGGGGGGGCFIATAAYGSYCHPYVEILRSFRDAFLMTNRPGRSFVRAYYAWSPPIADAIRTRETVKAVVRMTLLPLIAMAYLCLALGVGPTLGVPLFVLGLLCLGVKKSRRS